MKIIVALLLLGMPAVSQAFDRKGNGGDVVYCQNGGQPKAELLDFYEARILLGKTLQNPPGDDYRAKATAVFEQLKVRQPSLAEKLVEGLANFEKDSRRLTGVTLPDVPDSNHVAIPTGCEIRQIVIQTEPNFPGPVFTISQDLWNLLDAQNQVGLVTHELMYRIALGSAAKDSIGVRYLNGILFSDGFALLTDQTLFNWFSLANIPFIDVNISSELRLRLPTFGIAKECSTGACEIIGTVPVKPQFDDAGKLIKAAAKYLNFEHLESVPKIFSPYGQFEIRPDEYNTQYNFDLGFTVSGIVSNEYSRWQWTSSDGEVISKSIYVDGIDSLELCFQGNTSTKINFKNRYLAIFKGEAGKRVCTPRRVFDGTATKADLWNVSNGIGFTYFTSISTTPELQMFLASNKYEVLSGKIDLFKRDEYRLRLDGNAGLSALWHASGGDLIIQDFLNYKAVTRGVYQAPFGVPVALDSSVIEFKLDEKERLTNVRSFPQVTLRSSFGTIEVKALTEWDYATSTGLVEVVGSNYKVQGILLAVAPIRWTQIDSSGRIRSFASLSAIKLKDKSGKIRSYKSGAEVKLSEEGFAEG